MAAPGTHLFIVTVVVIDVFVVVITAILSLHTFEMFAAAFVLQYIQFCHERELNVANMEASLIVFVNDHFKTFVIDRATRTINNNNNNKDFY